MGRRIFAPLTFVVFLVTAWMVFANVFSDVNEFTGRALDAARARAGCRDCNPSRERFERGMISQTIDYDFPRAGPIEVVCRRQAIVYGEYTCTAQ